MPEKLFMEDLHWQATAAIASRDPAESKRFVQGTGMPPNTFSAMLERQGLVRTREAVQKHLDVQVGEEGIMVRVVQLPCDVPKTYGVVVLNGHRAGEQLHDGDWAVQFDNLGNAQNWLDRAGYSLVDRAPTENTLTMEERLSLAFSAVIRGLLTPDQLEALRRKNDPYRSHACATHDYCDAKGAMAQAWATVMGEPLDANDPASAELWTDAWQLSAVCGFSPGGLQELEANLLGLST